MQEMTKDNLCVNEGYCLLSIRRELKTNKMRMEESLALKIKVKVK